MDEDYVMYEPAIFPRANADILDLADVNDRITYNMDYPRITMRNLMARNELYHFKALRSTLPDVILRTTQAKRKLPKSPFQISPTWFSDNYLDDSDALLQLTEELTRTKGNAMIIPIMEHRGAEPEAVDTIVVLMIASPLGVHLIDPFSPEMQLAVRNFFESTAFVKIVLNAVPELHQLWVLAETACKRIFCMSGYLTAKVIDEKIAWNWEHIPLPNFETLFKFGKIERIVIDSPQDVLGVEGLDWQLKSDQLLDYVQMIARLFDAMDTDSELVERGRTCNVSWDDCVRPISGYIMTTRMFGRGFWHAVSEARARRFKLHLFVPMLIHLYLKSGKLLVQEVNENLIEGMYKGALHPNPHPVGEHLQTINVDSCQSSGRGTAVFQLLLQMPVEQRLYDSADYCVLPGCFKDVWKRIERIAPQFVMEWQQGF